MTDSQRRREGRTQKPAISDETPFIALRSLTKSFAEGNRRRNVLDNVNLDVARGEMVALLGPSGSGKSTLLNLISGIDLPDSGEVLVASKALVTLSERERTLFRRNHVGFIFQFFNLIPTLTVRENLLMPLQLNGLGRDASQARISEMLEVVDLSDRADSYPDRLSGGEQQRIALARALVHEPDIVLADEPTGNLDAENGVRLVELLVSLVRDRRNTLVIVTHSREIAARAHRVLSIDSGRISEVSSGNLV